jgi:hypothetical protein
MVIFSLIRDSNHLMCPHCTNLFDATKVYRQAEVLAALTIQRHGRGALARRLHRPAIQTAMRRRSSQLAGAPLLPAQPSDGTRQSIEANTVTRFKASHVSLDHPRAVESSGQFFAHCPACSASASFSHMSESTSLPCTACDHIFNAVVVFKQAEVVAAIRVQKHVRGRLERNKQRFAHKLLTMGRKYHTWCPTCQLMIGFTPHRVDSTSRDKTTICCPNCSSVFDGAKALRLVSTHLLAALRIQRHARGRQARSRTRSRESVPTTTPSLPFQLKQPPEGARPGGRRMSVEAIAYEHVTRPGRPARSSLARASAEHKESRRPEIYVMQCPACLGDVHFSLVRDSNNLLCPTCSNLFDAATVQRQAEVVAAIRVQKHVRGRLERNKRRFAHKLLTMGRKYHTWCPTCQLMIGFTPHRVDSTSSDKTTICCPNCSSVFDGAKALRLVSTEVLATVRIQKHARGTLTRMRSSRPSEARGLPRAEEKIERAAEPTATTPAASAPSEHVLDAASDANTTPSQPSPPPLPTVAPPPTAPPLPAETEGLAMDRTYTLDCPVCFLPLSFTPLRDDTGMCPNCSSLFSGAKQLKALSRPIFAALRMQRFARGHIVRQRLRRSRSREEDEAPEAERVESLLAHSPPQPSSRLAPDGRLDEQSAQPAQPPEHSARLEAIAELPAPTASTAAPAGSAKGSGAAASSVAAAAASTQPPPAPSTVAASVQALIEQITTPQPGELNSTHCPNCSALVSFRPHGESDVTVCPACTHMFSGQEAMVAVAERAVLNIQRWMRGKVIRSMIKQLKRSMRPSQLIRARSAVGIGTRPTVQQQPHPDAPPPTREWAPQPHVTSGTPVERPMAEVTRPVGVTRLNMSRPSSVRGLARQPLAAHKQEAPRRRPGSSPSRRALRARPSSASRSAAHLGTRSRALVRKRGPARLSAPARLDARATSRVLHAMASQRAAQSAPSSSALWPRAMCLRHAHSA